MYNTDLPTRAELPSSRQLIRSTAIALATACVLLVTAVLPAEYGIDPTGIGNVLGLKQMGDIKVSLAAPADAPAATAAAPPPAAPAAAPATPAPAPAAQQRHETTVTLRPGEAAEVKLEMQKAASATFSWRTSGGPVNFDTHGEPPNAPKDFSHSYGRGRDATRDEGTIKAAFDGQHGWYWRNRSKSEVSIKLNTQGQYTTIKRVL